MTSTFGKNIKTTIFGSSHQAYMGLVIDGLDLGFKIDMDKLNDFLQRRAPGRSSLTTKRKEDDRPIFIQGIKNDTIVSETVACIFKNSDTRSKDYEIFRDKPRPGHADYVSMIKYKGKLDMDGSGPFSGRLTAPLCLAGGICKQILEQKNIEIAARIKSIGSIEDDEVDFVNPDIKALKEIAFKDIPVISAEKEKKMRALIEKVKKEKDSIGASVEIFAKNLPQGLGNPNYDTFEGRISSLAFSIPACRGIEFGSGFNSTRMKGSENNDQFIMENGKIKTKTNWAGGVVGGITNGMPLVFRLAFKPTPSIGKLQETVSIKNKENTSLEIKGRHDPCLALRTPPIAEAITALTILDFMGDL